MLSKDELLGGIVAGALVIVLEFWAVFVYTGGMPWEL